MATSVTEITVTFLCGLRGYHVYMTSWTPTLGDRMPAIHESGNTHDLYAIAARKRLPGTLMESTVGHLPKEISRITRYIMLYGALFSVKVVDTHRRRSPLVQGGLEIPVEVTVTMTYSEKNKVAMEKYEELVGKYYQEPVNGKFQDTTASILKEVGVEESSCASLQRPGCAASHACTMLFRLSILSVSFFISRQSSCGMKCK